MHGPALAPGSAGGAPGQLGHDLLGVHAADQHMAVVAIGRDDLVALLLDRLHADGDSLLADVEVTEPSNQAHAVELPGAFLEPPDEQHLAIEFEQLVFVDRVRRPV